MQAASDTATEEVEATGGLDSVFTLGHRVRVAQLAGHRLSSSFAFASAMIGEALTTQRSDTRGLRDDLFGVVLKGADAKAMEGVDEFATR